MRAAAPTPPPLSPSHPSLPQSIAKLSLANPSRERRVRKLSLQAHQASIVLAEPALTRTYPSPIRTMLRSARVLLDLSRSSTWPRHPEMCPNKAICMWSPAAVLEWRNSFPNPSCRVPRPCPRMEDSSPNALCERRVCKWGGGGASRTSLPQSICEAVLSLLKADASFPSPSCEHRACRSCADTYHPSLHC